MKHRRTGRIRTVLAACIACLGMQTGCETTQFYEREKQADRAANFDSDPNLTYIRNKAEGAREGGFGGFGGAAAGGCGCQ